MAKTTVLLQMDEKDKALIKEFANYEGVSVSELLRSSVMEKIEDYFDIKDADVAVEEYEKDQVAIPLADIIKGID